MDKNRIAYDLALCYAEVMFEQYLKSLNCFEKENVDETAFRLFCLFEEAYTALLMTDDAAFDLSGYEK